MNRRQFIEKSVSVGAGLILPLSACSLMEPQNKNKQVIRTINPSKDVSLVKGKDIERITEEAVNLLGGMTSFISRGDKVIIKPNIGWARTPNLAATTNPTVIKKAIVMCYNAGASKVSVTDLPCNSANITFHRTGIQQAAEEVDAYVYYPKGYRAKKMKLERPIYLPLDKKEVKSWLIYTDFMECDKLINIAVAKHHNLSKLTLGMKNWYGAISGRRNQLHQAIHESIASLAFHFKPDLTIIDGIRILLRNGPTGGSEKDTQVMNTIIASRNQVAADALGAKELFNMEPESIPFIIKAHEMGLGDYDLAKLNIMKKFI